MTWYAAREFLPLPLVKDKTILFFSVRMLAGRKFSVASGKVDIENLNGKHDLHHFVCVASSAVSTILFLTSWSREPDYWVLCVISASTGAVATKTSRVAHPSPGRILPPQILAARLNTLVSLFLQS